MLLGMPTSLLAPSLASVYSFSSNSDGTLVSFPEGMRPGDFAFYCQMRKGRDDGKPPTSHAFTYIRATSYDDIASDARLDTFGRICDGTESGQAISGGNVSGSCYFLLVIRQGRQFTGWTEIQGQDTARGLSMNISARSYASPTTFPTTTYPQLLIVTYGDVEANGLDFTPAMPMSGTVSGPSDVGLHYYYHLFKSEKDAQAYSVDPPSRVRQLFIMSRLNLNS